MAGIGNLGSYREFIGLAAARMEVRAFRVVMIPALAMETVCCSCLSALGDEAEYHPSQARAREDVDKRERAVGEWNPEQVVERGQLKRREREEEKKEERRDIP